ncbi:hypothetical protein KFL_005860110 [Klebsormidium nitens]|uniref:DNA topoisomerase (ATP-hydrolyzing) n=1 Tax=Klebsormidium nitens TaxID=105231 RepID=A0A1Y1ILI2_KLENI|nr:hypothetical protein KFL_005860110 [Klebsormidium nitens]|eukprot:GAQ89991.1 hypothetical protein KFL_005860110 [Klebsormidium nitens]
MPEKDVRKAIDRLKLKEIALAASKAKDQRLLVATNGSKCQRLKIPKLDDAPRAGTKDSGRCTLVLTEGDSAKTFVTAGGKLLNVTDASAQKLADNKEIGHLKQILGLKHFFKYTDLNQLRYGRVLIASDADVDGIHIRGLIIHFINTFWPELLTLGLVWTLDTPVIKAFPRGRVREAISFYTEEQFETWRAREGRSGWTVKYYKGLGTHTSSEAKVIFQTMKTSRFVADPEAQSSMRLAFSNKMTAERQQWMVDATCNAPSEPAGPDVKLTDFVYGPLALFGLAAIKRHIPSVFDGLKPSQRKILFTLLQAGEQSFTKEIKVAQLAAQVALKTSYRHGETSLASAIVKMAQDFVGSTNLNILEPMGQFGTRLQGGQDAASARYIYTRLTPIMKHVFDARDASLLRRLEEEGEKVEVEYYAPVIPMALVSGCNGVGYGFSTRILPREPAAVVANLKAMLRGGPPSSLPPYWNSFKGSVEEKGPGMYAVKGTFRRKTPRVLVVDELPVGYWTDDYKEFLESGKVKNLRDVFNLSTEDTVHFELTFESEADLEALLGSEDPHKLLDLSRSFSDKNICAFDTRGIIRKYETVDDMLEEYYGARLELYKRRKEHLLAEAEERLKNLQQRRVFVRAVVHGRLIIARREQSDVLRDIVETVEPTPSADQAKDLMGMRLTMLTNERLREVEASLEDVQREIADLRSNDEKTLWLADLNELIKFL